MSFHCYRYKRTLSSVLIFFFFTTSFQMRADLDLLSKPECPVDSKPVDELDKSSELKPHLKQKIQLKHLWDSPLKLCFCILIMFLVPVQALFNIPIGPIRVLKNVIDEPFEIVRRWNYYSLNKDKLASQEIQNLKEKFSADIVKRHGNFITKALYTIKKIINPERVYIIEDKELNADAFYEYNSGVHIPKKMFKKNNHHSLNGTLLHELVHGFQHRLMFGILDKNKRRDGSGGNVYWREYNANKIMIDELYKNKMYKDILKKLKSHLSYIDRNGNFKEYNRTYSVNFKEDWWRNSILHPYVYGLVDQFCKVCHENPNDQSLKKICRDLNKNRWKYFFKKSWCSLKSKRFDLIKNRYYFRNDYKIMKKLIEKYDPCKSGSDHSYQQYKKLHKDADIKDYRVYYILS